MYARSLITFLDILGFGELVRVCTAEEVKDKLAALSELATPDRKYGSQFLPQTIQFSDSVVRVQPIDTGENAKYQIGILFQEILDLAHAQAGLIEHGILLRGGMAIGDVQIEPNNVFGPGLVKAYNLESTFAVYPRIVIDPELLRESRSSLLLKSEIHTPEEDSRYVHDLLCCGDDNFWFIDYCRVIHDDYPSGYVRLLQQQRRVITEAATKYKAMSSVLVKYLWLARYHNDCVRDVPSAAEGQREDPGELAIKDGELVGFHMAPQDPDVRECGVGSSRGSEAKPDGASDAG